MPGNQKLFLKAFWHHLLMLNYEVDPEILKPIVPAGTELDDWRGNYYLSLVAFLFTNTRVFGLKIPYHTEFEEVNLRFYVRHKAEDGWRRGVVFIKELVPRHTIAWVARSFYGENYIFVPMKHSLFSNNQVLTGFSHLDEPVDAITYSWIHNSNPFYLEAKFMSLAGETNPGSIEEFITEHYWGYSFYRGNTLEYEVKHPKWNVRVASSSTFSGDVLGLYGKQFIETLQDNPTSAFLAEGSEVCVYRGKKINMHKQ
jgi:uncharacterized protein YqjF (DUF2071 family)